jgi:hypothetical protein
MADDPIQSYLDQLERSYKPKGLQRLGDLVEDGMKRWMCEFLGLQREDVFERSRNLFLAHQYRIISVYGDLPQAVTMDMFDDIGHNIRRLPTDVEFNGPFGKQMAFGQFRIDRWISDYIVDNVFGPFLQYGDQLSFESEHYRRGWRDESTPEDLVIDEFLGKGKTYQDNQVTFLNQSLESDTFYLASDLRLEHLNAQQGSQLLGRVNQYLTALIFSEVFYPGRSNPFGGAIDRLLRASVVLDFSFEHPFVGGREISYHEGDEYGYFPSGYWASNPVGDRDSVFLGDSRFERCRDRLTDGTRAMVIGGRGIGNSYYPSGELVQILD